jgi:hypothetical protein
MLAERMLNNAPAEATELRSFRSFAVKGLFSLPGGAVEDRRTAPIFRRLDS